MQQNQTFNHFSSQEMKNIRDLINKLTESVQPKLVLTPHESSEQSLQYNKEKRLFVGKIAEYRLMHPELSSKEVDWDKFNLLFADNAFLKSTMLCLQAILLKMDNTRIIYDTEIYNLALGDYENTRSEFEAGKLRYENKLNELKQLLSNIR